MHAFAAYFVGRQQNTVKTDTKRISWLPRDSTKTATNRSADVRDTARCSELAWTLLRDGPGASGDCARNPFGRFADALGTPRASPDRSWDGSRATRTRHKRGLERLQNSLERPKLPTIEFLFIFGSNWPLLGSLACCIRAFHRSFDHTFICSLDLKVSVTRALRRIGIYVSYIQAPPSVLIILYFDWYLL